jgi:hypothetical protein
MLRQRKVTYPFGTVTSDFVGPLRRSSRGKRYIVVFQDNFTKWVEARVLPRADSAAAIRALRELVVSRFGTPKYLVSDNGQYTSQAFRAYCVENGILQFFTSTY